MKIYIYSLSDPRTNEIRYIGKTGNIRNRYRSHIYSSKSNSSKVGRWIKSIRLNGFLPIINVIEECTLDNWEEREKYYISLHSNLCNIHIGGNQPSFHKRAVKKYSFKKNKYVVNCSYNNIIYYLGSFNTSEEAVYTYDLFKSNPSDYINTKITRKFNTSGVIMYKDNIIINCFNTISECAKYLNTSVSSISRVCRGKGKTHKGYVFKYKSSVDS